MGRGRGSPGPKAGDEAGLGSGGGKAHRPLREGIRVDLPLRLRAPGERGGLLAYPTHGQHGAVLAGPAGVRQGGGSRKGKARAVGGGQGRVAHRRRGGGGPRRDTPGEFLPSGSPELQPAERLWPLTNEALANRPFPRQPALPSRRSNRWRKRWWSVASNCSTKRRSSGVSPTTIGGPGRRDQGTLHPDSV